jgi:hypothetical protein
MDVGFDCRVIGKNEREFSVVGVQGDWKVRYMGPLVQVLPLAVYPEVNEADRKGGEKSEQAASDGKTDADDRSGAHEEIFDKIDCLEFALPTLCLF